MPFIQFNPQPRRLNGTKIPNPFAQTNEPTAVSIFDILTWKPLPDNNPLSTPFETPSASATNPSASPSTQTPGPTSTPTESNPTPPPNPFQLREDELEAHRRTIQSQINATEQYLNSIHQRIEEYRRLSEQLLQQSRSEMEKIIASVPQKEPINKAEAIAVAIASLFNPAAAGAAAAGILNAKEQRYQNDLKRYEMLAENALRRYQIESQQAANQFRNLIDYAQTDLQRNMMLLQSLYNQLGATEEQKNQLLKLKQQNEWTQARLALQNEWNKARLELSQDRLMLDFWKAEEQIRMRQGELFNQTIRLLSQGAAANMTPEQIQSLLQEVPGLENLSVLNHPAMAPLLQNVAELAQSSQRYRSARANLQETSAQLLEKYGEADWQTKLQKAFADIKYKEAATKLAQIRATLAGINLKNAQQGKISPSQLNQLAMSLIIMDQIAQWAEENDQPLNNEFYEIREALGEVLMLNLRPLGINVNVNPPAGSRSSRLPSAPPSRPSSGAAPTIVAPGLGQYGQVRSPQPSPSGQAPSRQPGARPQTSPPSGRRGRPVGP